jgi:hypothetical protein
MSDHMNISEKLVPALIDEGFAAGRLMVLSSPSELSRLKAASPSCAVMAGESTTSAQGGTYFRVQTVSVYLKTSLMADSASERADAEAAFEMVCRAVEKTFPDTPYSHAVISSAGDTVLMRKISLDVHATPSQPAGDMMLDTLQLPDMYIKYQPPQVLAHTDRTIDGGEVTFVQESTGGALIDVYGSGSFGCIPYDLLCQLRELCLRPDGIYVLICADGQLLNVRFRHEDAPAIEMTPVTAKPVYGADDLFCGIIKLKEVI